MVRDLIEGRLPSTVILLDFDGTLSHVASRPGDATAIPGSHEIIAGLIAKVGRVGLVSGRPVADLRPRLEVDGLYYSGMYGLEHALGKGEIEVEPSAATWLEVVAGATAEAESWVSSDGRRTGKTDGGTAGIEVEPKGLAVTLHYRNSPHADAASELVDRWARECAARHGLRVVYGKFNVELLPPVESDKGRAVVQLADGFDRCIYVGDDVGDLPAFDALSRMPEKTISVAVRGPEMPEAVAEHADISVDGPDGVLELLEAIASFS